MMLSQIARRGSTPPKEHQYLLRPGTLNIRLVMNTAGKADMAHPKYDLEIEVESIEYELAHGQYRDLLWVAEDYASSSAAKDVDQHEDPSDTGRPTLRPKDDPKGWWAYIGGRVLADVRE
eukprot:CAMPEP_0184362798 /NCGR_PEP_ID=MMETSP1089-20130417/136572_1 /TAXON_ID=38269 ORGANISM="Gloeochaete wittrockiana, Strain SAG46.84" /NCGR_SAMPLE_ID=MMETSP1089 /ASSEMBLY_ACC=CAM_ASM_000445 /LENGTH=119 /DNA_ID=CAMNT_0026703039 /DNA_START=26 /DNA_END=382 /DNA_ORIENTATION=-